MYKEVIFLPMTERLPICGAALRATDRFITLLYAGLFFG
jgi:hypothetical protein